MPQFAIHETIVTTIEADSAQSALDAYLNDTAKVVELVVTSRTITDDEGKDCDIIDH